MLEVGGVYTARWPTELTLRSWPEPDRPPFYMLGDDAGSLIYVQGPFEPASMPDLDGMLGEGQRELRRGAAGALRWIDLAYEHKGESWQQRHLLAPLGNSIAAIVMAQARAAASEPVMSLAVDFAESIEAGRGAE